MRELRGGLAGLRIGTPVLLTIEVTPGGAVLRELATVEGQVLFDDSLHHHVVTAANDAGRYAIVAGVFMALLGLIATWGPIWRFSSLPPRPPHAAGR